MLSLLDLSKLATPLIARAGDSLHAQNLDFAAIAVSEKLGLNSSRPSRDRRDDEQRYLKRSAWIDRKVAAFIDSNPTGLCVEIFSGLSTRFHRLSFSSDWPRFNWKMINNEDVTGYLKNTLGKTENLELHACSNPVYDWLYLVDWSIHQKVMIMVGEDEPIDTYAEVKQFLNQLASFSQQNNLPIEAVLVHQLNDLSCLVDRFDAVEVMDEDITLCTADNGFLGRLIKGFGEKSKTTCMAHIVVSAGEHES